MRCPGASWLGFDPDGPQCNHGHSRLLRPSRGDISGTVDDMVIDVKEPHDKRRYYVKGMAENDDNDGNGTITITPLGNAALAKSAHPRRDVGCQRCIRNRHCNS